MKQSSIDLPLLHLIHSCPTHSFTLLEIKLHSNVFGIVSKRRFHIIRMLCVLQGDREGALLPMARVHTRERDLCAAVTMTD